MRIAQYVPGKVLVIEVPSRSRGRRFLHHINLDLNRHDQVVSVVCSCEGFNYRRACHHVSSLRDMAGVLLRRRA